MSFDTSLLLSHSYLPPPSIHPPSLSLPFSLSSSNYSLLPPPPPLTQQYVPSRVQFISALFYNFNQSTSQHTHRHSVWYTHACMYIHTDTVYGSIVHTYIHTYTYMYTLIICTYMYLSADLSFSFPVVTTAMLQSTHLAYPPFSNSSAMFPAYIHTCTYMHAHKYTCTYVHINQYTVHSALCM